MLISCSSKLNGRNPNDDQLSLVEHQDPRVFAHFQDPSDPSKYENLLISKSDYPNSRDNRFASQDINSSEFMSLGENMFVGLGDSNDKCNSINENQFYNNYSHHNKNRPEDFETGFISFNYS